MLGPLEINELTKIAPDQRKRVEGYFVALRTNELSPRHHRRSEGYFVNSFTSSRSVQTISEGVSVSVLFTFGTQSRFTRRASTLHSLIPEPYRVLPDGRSTAETLARLLTADRPAPHRCNTGYLRRQGRKYAVLTDDVLHRARSGDRESNDSDPLYTLADQASARTLSHGYRGYVIHGGTSGYWNAMMPLTDWPAVTLAYLHHAVTGDRSLIDWYRSQDRGHYPTTRRRTGPGSGPCRTAAAVDWATLPASALAVTRREAP
jgi:hypothetical protein